MPKLVNELFHDEDALPPEGVMANMLVWITEDEDGSGGFFPVVLDGAAWVRTIELFEPDFRGFPDVMPEGLYVLEVDVLHQVDSVGDIDDVVIRVHRVKRLPAPTRERLIASPFDDFLFSGLFA